MKNFTFLLLLLLPPFLYGQKIGVNTSSPQTTLDVNGSVALREGIPLSISGLTGDDLSIGTYSVYRIIDALGDFSIFGIAGGQDGRIVMLINGTSFNMIIGHQALSSSLTNRIVTNTNTDVVLLPNGIITLIYSNISQKWLVTSITGASDNAYNAWNLTGNSNTSSLINFIGTTNAQDLVFKTNNTEGVRLSSSGNVGIGSSSPSNKLTVAGNANVSNHLAVGANSAINDGSLIQSGSTFNNIISVQEEVTGNQTTNYTEGILSHLSINATNNPTTEFYALDAIAEVKMSNTRNYASVVGNYNGASHRGTGTVSRLYGICSYAQNKATGIVSDLRGFHIYPANNSTGSVTNSYGIFTKGINNIGAGTVTNAYGLFIDASCNTGGGVLTNNYGLYVEDQSSAGTTHFNLYSKGASSKNYFEGNVGIGVNNPSHKLQVVGTAGLSTGTAWTNTSDRRVKEDIQPYKRGLKEILAINPVFYKYTKASGIGSGEQNIGIIAQEVEKILPEAIMTTPITLKDGSIIQDGKHLYRADAIWFAMINAFQELNKENEKLKADNNMLQMELESLKSELKKQGTMTNSLLERMEKIETLMSSKTNN